VLICVFARWKVKMATNSLLNNGMPLSGRGGARATLDRK
jgi:hypothetical protein